MPPVRRCPPPLAATRRRADRIEVVMHRSGPALDRSVPALLVKVGRYPQHHGGVGALRTLGRGGVPVHAVVENRLTPAALCRYTGGRFVRPSTGFEQPADLADALLAIGRSIGRRSVAVATDDEAALLLAEHADRLAEWFLLPPVPAGLPRRLADKDGLHRLCLEHGVPTPLSRAPTDRAGLLATGRELGYPLVLKNLEAWTRLRAPAVHHTTVVRDERELLAAFPADTVPSVLVQEYLPPEQAEDWITHLYCPADGSEPLVFTARKIRSWPPDAGVTTRARALENPPLAEQAREFCRRVGYRGVADLDWRLDRRDGRYKLVDFNPRTGAQFRLFETEDGVDVVRALHLDLTGRPVPRRARQRARAYTVGQLDLPSAAVWAWRERRLPPELLPRRSTERAWFCLDDPVPALAESVLFGGSVAQRLASPVRRTASGDRRARRG
ncbi:ATP-grasp domain-containing protein [Streptacidiphilus sp. PB12-B1b]|uniref:carboxylate--amine ligase n=1 Tax=Streptacidiphilus sp. PB12-B1b TaxID=2705012 RepID=UPI0015FA3CB6|nr:ATP-grasp domain-containing protein [Streptacidiphilus sp. PB12-B1b]QMU77473.1 ATP-grasp domain-containing protein [Streptacidiphilus sp. PB12-B1b]